MFWPGIVFDCPVKGYGKCCDICSSNYQPGENNITFANFAKAAGFSFINAQNQGVVDLCISFDDGDISDKELRYFKKMDSAPYVLHSCSKSIDIGLHGEVAGWLSSDKPMTDIPHVMRVARHYVAYFCKSASAGK